MRNKELCNQMMPCNFFFLLNLISAKRYIVKISQEKKAVSHLTLQTPTVTKTYPQAICFSAAKHNYSISINTTKGTLNAGFSQISLKKKLILSSKWRAQWKLSFRQYLTDDPSVSPPPPTPTCLLTLHVCLSQLTLRGSLRGAPRHKSFKTSSAAVWQRPGVSGSSPLQVAPCCASRSPVSPESHGSAANTSGRRSSPTRHCD